MNKQDKDLLIKYLSISVLYNPKVHWGGNENYRLREMTLTDVLLETNSAICHWEEDNTLDKYRLDQVRPLLRSMDSMTEEESVEYCELQDKFLRISKYLVTEGFELFEWLLKNHFDFMGLLDRNLADKASKDTYNNP